MKKKGETIFSKLETDVKAITDEEIAEHASTYEPQEGDHVVGVMSPQLQRLVTFRSMAGKALLGIKKEHARHHETRRLIRTQEQLDRFSAACDSLQDREVTASSDYNLADALVVAEANRAFPELRGKRELFFGAGGVIGWTDSAKAKSLRSEREGSTAGDLALLHLLFGGDTGGGLADLLAGAARI